MRSGIVWELGIEVAAVAVDGDFDGIRLDCVRLTAGGSVMRSGLNGSTGVAADVDSLRVRHLGSDCV